MKMILVASAFALAASTSMASAEDTNANGVDCSALEAFYGQPEGTFKNFGQYSKWAVETGLISQKNINKWSKDMGFEQGEWRQQVLGEFCNVGSEAP